MTNIDKVRISQEPDPVMELADLWDSRKSQIELWTGAAGVAASTEVKSVEQTESGDQGSVPLKETMVTAYDEHALTVKNLQDTFSGKTVRTAKRVLRQQVETGEISFIQS